LRDKSPLTLEKRRFGHQNAPIPGFQPESILPECIAGAAVCIITAIIAILGLAATGFWLWMLIDAITRCPSENNLKLIWILVIVFTGVIGALIYLFVQRPKNPAKGEAPPAPPPPPHA